MAIAPTTSSQIGITPRPGIASRISPGRRSQRQPSTTKSRIAVTMSTDHTSGGARVTKKEMPSEIAAIAKAKISQLFEIPTATSNRDLAWVALELSIGPADDVRISSALVGK